MPRSLVSSTLTLLTLILMLVLYGPLGHGYQPIPSIAACYAHEEGQGLYVIGGSLEDGTTQTQAFILDLSVSWNTSNPAFRKLKDGPKVVSAACTMYNNGQDLFVLSKATAYLYNVRSDLWSPMRNDNFMDTSWIAMATDPESGIIYIPNGAMEWEGNKVVLALDMKTGKSNITAMPPINLGLISAAWCAPLRSLLFIQENGNRLRTFAPSNLSESSNGWSTLNTTGEIIFARPTCFYPAYGGSKMVLYNGIFDPSDIMQSAVFILDVATRTWTRGPSIRAIAHPACAVSGDYLILWGGEPEVELRISGIGGNRDTFSNKTLVYNMKKQKWMSSYIPPPVKPTATSSRTLEASQTPSQHMPSITTLTGQDSTRSNDQELANVIVIVVGVILAIILTTISVYLGLTKRMDPGNQGASSDDLIASDIDTDSRGSDGVRPIPEHPHAIIEDPTAKRNVQVGAVEVQMILQQPHAVLKEGFLAGCNDKAEWESLDERLFTAIPGDKTDIGDR